MLAEEVANWLGGRRALAEEVANWLGGRRALAEEVANWLGGRELLAEEVGQRFGGRVLLVEEGLEWLGGRVWGAGLCMLLPHHFGELFMALKRLTAGEMIHITQTWVDAKHRHHQLMKVPAEVAVLLSHVERVHLALMALQPTVDPQAKSRVRILEELDAQHDDMVRTIYHLFLAQIYLSQVAAERELWQRLLDTVLPDGLMVVKRSYSDEVGQATLAHARLSAEDKKQLRTLVLGKESMLALIERYVQVAQKLGEVATVHYQPTVQPSRADAASARNQWIRVVNTVLAAIDMIPNNEDLLREVVAPLREVERRAERRRSTAEPEPTEPVAPPVPPTPDPS